MSGGNQPHTDRGGERKLRVIEMFAGIGGFSVGLHRTDGFETIAVAEVDKYASQVLALRFPDAPNLGDVTTAEYPDADVICGGFPCQDISYAGAGAGLAGKRSGLFWEVVRAIRLVRPEYVVLENVAALLSRGLDEVLWALAEVGYDTEWHCIPASAVGARHRRDRIWIVAYPRHSAGAGPEAGKRGDARIDTIQQVHRQEGPNTAFRSRPPLSGWLADELANADSQRGERRRPFSQQGREHEPTNCGETLADAASIGQSGPRQSFEWGSEEAHGEGQAADAVPSRLGDFWAVEPDVGRVAHGVPKRVDRLRCLGNAVVPAIPELIGRAILSHLRASRFGRAA